MHEPDNKAVSDPEAERRAHTGQDQALCDQLANNAAPACAEGTAHGEFSRARGGASQQQVREIHAGDKQNHADCEPENNKGAAETPAHVILQRHGNH